MKKLFCNKYFWAACVGTAGWMYPFVRMTFHSIVVAFAVGGALGFIGLAVFNAICKFCRGWFYSRIDFSKEFT